VRQLYQRRFQQRLPLAGQLQPLTVQPEENAELPHQQVAILRERRHSLGDCLALRRRRFRHGTLPQQLYEHASS